MYAEIKGIDYVLYINKTNNKLQILDLINNRNETVENTGESWNDAAYGNCLIALKNAKLTDALYLLTKQGMDSIGRIDINNTKEVERVLREKAINVVERQ